MRGSFAVSIAANAFGLTPKTAKPSGNINPFCLRWQYPRPNPPYQTASSRWIQGLPKFTSLSITSESSLLRDLAHTRKRGYSIDHQERATGMRCIAAPIFNACGEPVAGLSVSGPAFRINLSDAAKIGQAVRDAAHSVTNATGGEVPH